MSDQEGELERLRRALQHRYQLKKVLGRGGMATVYLAEEPRHSRHLALKERKRIATLREACHGARLTLA